ncbi:MAG: DUF2939 domain-containing protein [Polyangiaceae bacterium]|nr:DUF2939 domain-containing protein [Polyangiaceae bacterium]
MAKSRLVVVCLAACVLTGAVLLAGPYVALHQLQSAASTGDVQALSELVDFDQVRTNTKIRLRSSIEQRVPAGLSGLAMVGAAVAGAALDPLVDSVISPQTVAGWVKEPPSSLRGTPTKGQGVETKTHFVSFSQFVASVNNGGAQMDLVLTRNYLRWRLTDVRFDLSLDKLMSQLGLPALGGAVGGAR